MMHHDRSKAAISLAGAKKYWYTENIHFILFFHSIQQTSNTADITNITLSIWVFSSLLRFIPKLPRITSRRLKINFVNMKSNLDSKDENNDCKLPSFPLEKDEIGSEKGAEFPPLSKIEPRAVSLHKELLFRLFMKCDEKELASLKFDCIQPKTNLPKRRR